MIHPLASKKCLSYQSPVCTVLSVRLKNKKPKRSNVGSITKCSRPSAKQVENWSKMPKKTLWRWLEKLEKAHRISTFSYLKKWSIHHAQGGVPHKTTRTQWRSVHWKSWPERPWNWKTVLVHPCVALHASRCEIRKHDHESRGQALKTWSDR